MNKTDATLIRKILIPDNFVKLDKNLVRVLGIKHAGFLSILIDFDKYINQKKLYIKRNDGEWFYLSVEEGEDRYMLTKDEQQKLCDDLSKLGIIEFKIFGLPRRKYIKLNYTYILELVTMEESDIDIVRESIFIPILRKRNKGLIGGKNPLPIAESIRQPLYGNKKQTYKDYNIPSEKSEDNISLLTSNTTMYEVSKTNIESNCTLPINDVTISVEKPKKKSKSNFQSNPERYIWINAKLKEWNDNSPTDIQIKRPKGKEKTGYFSLGLVYDKYGEEKATAFFDYILSKDGRYRNQFSLATPKNQEEFENFYQDPQEEQPKYISDKKFDSFRRYKQEQEEPSLGSFYNEDSFYAALEYFYSNQFDGTELVKKVRERVKEINCKYNRY
jgi:hypothetical protein